ncbi:MAG: ribulose-phosphate 3-epimerase [Chitinophagales bacterium]|jgi:ribulose-phosphate 3-epimerase|nr:ribulose-phosphate 3-epimerase [Chitinophagales bacterium]
MKNKPRLVAPSVLSANFLRLEDELNELISARADFIHFDIMDGVNVPNISFGFPVLEAINAFGKFPIDVHFMIQSPLSYLEQVISYAAVENVSIPIEHFDFQACMNLVTPSRVSFGAVLNPETPISSLSPYLEQIDRVLLMSVKPGFGGQKFIEDTYQKIEALKSLLDSISKKIHIQIDGGVDTAIARKLFDLQVDSVVCGSSLFKSNSYYMFIREMKNPE